MKVMVNSIPKGGTHLLLKLVYMLGIHDDPKRFWLGAGVIKRGFQPWNKLVKHAYSREKVQIGCETPVMVGASWLVNKLQSIPDDHSFGAHCIYSEKLSRIMESNDIRVVCVLRDPRAIVASHMHYVKKWENHFFHKEYMALPSDEDRLRFSIMGGRLGKHDVVPIGERYTRFKGWMKDGNAMVVKFEDIIGVNGGGSMESQYEAITSVANHLDIAPSEAVVDKIQSEIFGSAETGTQSETFRKGKIDSWRDELSVSLIELLDDELAGLRSELNY